MAQRRFHYEKAFEHFLRANGVPYVAVDEAKRALQATGAAKLPIKSFDFVVYGGEGSANLLVDVKGRKHSGRSASGGGTGKQLQNWVTREDVAGLKRWSGIFGAGFEPVFVFLFWCDAPPPDALFLEVFEFGERWYAVQAIRLSDYEPAMRERSKKWETVSVPARHFAEHARPIKELLNLQDGDRS
ncbi:MAG: HYExAFE family protein [Planctomycetota bacterium]